MKKIYPKHIPVLLTESIAALNIKKDGIYFDCTFGTGGHSTQILKKIGKYGKLYAIDRDPEAITNAQKINNSRFEIIHGLFSNIENIAKNKNIVGKINGILLDLGMSDIQLKNPQRGFSFIENGPLDMRMNQNIGISAANWLKKTTKNEIYLILKKFGEEKFAKKIAQAIYNKNKKNPIHYTKELVEIIKSIIPIRNKFKHPATRTFQAIRIYLNQEIEELKKILVHSLKILTTGGRLSIISFHSLEDRIIKKFIKHNSAPLYIPKNLPITENKLHELHTIQLCNIARIFPTQKEIINNKKARSAILRVAEKIK
ncbi:16S rRNA (cytosine(1402)-N(4))-methyltransferase RsmH [Buchnera aphidicola (Formosaphis micheliae)]|uniref:16S rRNA (cytosine(1402)-N(4))-methyltransferase RsmH n=1 Tax=Buchnera aphidicola TaxID=9 RepID=UPI0031CCC40C